MSKLLGIKQLCEFWQSIKSTFVKKTGDTMTGDLTINKGTPAVYTKGSGINATAANNGSSSTQYGGLYVYDKDGRAINYHGVVASTSGPITAEIVAYNYNSSGQQTGVNYIQARVAKDGTSSYTVKDPAAFRSAIGAVNKAGDTMTGGLTFNNVGNAILYTGAHATYAMIKFKDGTDAYGNGIVIGGGGLTVIGGGESADAIAGSISSGNSEQLCLCNDGAIDIYTNCQNGAASAVHTTINGKTFSGRAVCLKDQTNDNDTYLNYGAAALTWSDITFFAAWNGYSLRAINKSQITPANIGAASRSWTALGNVTGTTPLTLNLTNYSEIYVSGNYSTVYRSGMLIPKNFISATEYEWYLGGGNKGSSSPSGRRGVFKLTLTKFTPVLMTVDGVDYTSSTCNWYVYAR